MSEEKWDWRKLWNFVAVDGERRTHARYELIKLVICSSRPADNSTTTANKLMSLFSPCKRFGAHHIKWESPNKKQNKNTNAHNKTRLTKTKFCWFCSVWLSVGCFGRKCSVIYSLVIYTLPCAFFAQAENPWHIHILAPQQAHAWNSARHRHRRYAGADRKLLPKKSESYLRKWCGGTSPLLAFIVFNNL